MDLFRIPGLKSIYKNRWFPLVPQIIALICFGLLVYGGIGITTDDSDFAKTLRNTNLANLIVWSYWWPLIIIFAVLAGRHWCTICPMELVTTVMGKAGLRLKPGRFLKSGWVMTLSYGIILLVGIHTFAIHRIPDRMAIYMLALLGVAILAGLIWEKRTFCTHICPVGHLLGLYSLLSATEWRSRSQEVCKACKTKECVAEKRLYHLTARSCTSDIYPGNIQDNRKCILCSQCLSACPKDNLTLRLRKPLADLFADIKLSSAELGFLVVVSGFVVYEILSEWSVTKGLLLALPASFSTQLGITGIWTGTTNALLLFVLFPLVFVGLFGGIRKIVSGEPFKHALSAIVLALLPVMAAMHLLKSMLKMTSRLPYLSHALNDPKGIKTANMLVNGSLLLDKTAVQVLQPFITGVAILLPLAGWTLSLWVMLRHQGQRSIVKAITLAAVLVYAGLFEASILFWRVW
ncbi:MAG: 4Fe-4S binding protein [Candidatus Marinimicrobia bacterium]|nr:4Fe-4S binding protein [Candidatus Neomarinimicrobiota bacterium]